MHKFCSKFTMQSADNYTKKNTMLTKKVTLKLNHYSDCQYSWHICILWVLSSQSNFVMKVLKTCRSMSSEMHWGKKYWNKISSSWNYKCRVASSWWRSRDSRATNSHINFGPKIVRIFHSGPRASSGWLQQTWLATWYPLMRSVVIMGACLSLGGWRDMMLRDMMPRRRVHSWSCIYST